LRVSLPTTMRALGFAAGLAVFAAALVALYHILTEVRLADVVARFHATPWSAVLASLALTATSYLTMTGYDALALRHLGRALPYGKVVLASFASYAFSHNMGLALITGGSIRYRIYSAAGLSAAEIATLIVVCALTFALGASVDLGLALLLEPAALDPLRLSAPAVNRALGLVILAAVAGYVTWTALRRRPLRFRAWTARLPSLSITLGQIGLGVFDIALAAGALYVLLPSGLGIGFAAFMGIFIGAVTLGVLSHTPGGLGVFESAMLLALPGAEPGALFGALLVYRCLYYLLPLAVAAVLLAGHEFHLRRVSPAATVQAALDLSRAAAPQVIGTAVFAGGAILLFAAALPGLDARLEVLRDVLPLPFVEASHLLSSVVGLLMMVLARGLFRRFDGAWHLTVAVVGGGIAFALLKGFDVGEALLLSVLLLMLLASRSAFYRKASLLGAMFSPAWIATIAAAIAASVWLGLFAYKHVDYANGLWWQFAYHADAPRFLRASVAVIVVALGLLTVALLRPAPPRPQRARSDPDAIRAIVAGAARADANLALTGDKSFLMAPGADAFIMYRVRGRSWVAMGEPVGPEAAWDGLLWEFRDLCDRHAGWPVFYQVGPESLPRFLDLGLALLKLGEEARVELRTFSLSGSGHRDLRYAERRAAKEGARFEIVPAASVGAVLPELARVSEAWLAAKATREKGFSVGSFSPGYVGQCDCAVVRRGGEVVCFANIWAAPAGGELSVDLMRQRAEAPYGVMDFLFVHLMLWGKAQGYEWFNLGMAPLSGLDPHRLGPLWHRLGTFAFRHGEHFYNFEGLKAYKAKFAPVWTPKYLAAPGGLALPRTLLDVAALIAGGTGEIFRK
jgi:phosphatidylglycerol lysyltransferase